MKPVRVTLVPLVVAFAALFVILPRTGGDGTIQMSGTAGSYSFEPSELNVDEAGVRIRVVNDSDTTHTMTSVVEGFDLVVQPGEAKFLSAGQSGTLDYYCRYHGTSDEMTGKLAVGGA